ncbi:sensor histidine kinase [Ruminococcus callidus]|uniref:sensor histidine kinase n=1 Tax=Ruminococcus callidus TaxID=40519 RepID=UPI0023F8A386|nr:GHKL domain-containing protein [Ruminococcus callidus]
MGTILYIASNSIRVYAISVFINIFLGKSRLSLLLNRLTYVFYFLISTIGWLYGQSTTLNLILNTLPILLITLQYYSSWSKKIFSVISSCAVGMFIDWMGFAVFGNTEIIESGFIQAIIFLILCSLFRYYYKNQEDYSFKSRYSWLLILIAVGTALIGVLTVNEDSSYDYLIALILLFINFLNFYIYNLEQESFKAQHKLKLIETSNYAYQNQIKIMNESQQKIRFLRHDFYRHINKLKNLSEENDVQSIKQYLNEMEDTVVVKKEYSKTGNDDVDSLLNYELSLAAEFGAEIIYDVNLPEKLNISSFDITIILGNLMDNAIEALRNSEKKLLKVNIQFNKGIIRIDIENSYDPKYKKKHDGREHGIGLLSVENTLQKYHGKLDSYPYPEESKYHTTAIFYNSLDE